MKLKIIVSALFIMSFLTPFVVKADTVYFAQPVFSGVSGKVFLMLRQEMFWVFIHTVLVTSLIRSVAGLFPTLRGLM